MPIMNPINPDNEITVLNKANDHLVAQNSELNIRIDQLTARVEELTSTNNNIDMSPETPTGFFVPEESAQIFRVLQKDPINVNITIRNTGDNPVDYNFQEWDGTTWNDLGDLNGELAIEENNTIQVSANFSEIRCMASSVGTSYLDFEISP